MPEIEIQKYSLYLFDLDDTLTTSASGDKFPKTVDDRKWMPGRLEKLQALHAQGNKTAIITNQGGAAWGIFSQEEMYDYLNNLVWEAGMDAFFVCFHDTGPKARASDKTIKELTKPDHYKGHERRKPGPGMLIEAMDDFEIDRQDTLYIGDRPEDDQSAKAAGIDFIHADEYFK